MYYYPNDNGNDFYDGSPRIAPPGRVIGDQMTKTAGDEPWMDLYGETATYNVPGVMNDENWRLRVPGLFREVYTERRARGEAMDVPGALALAMRARGDAFVRSHEGLVAALEAQAAVRL